MSKKNKITFDNTRELFNKIEELKKLLYIDFLSICHELKQNNIPFEPMEEYYGVAVDIDDLGPIGIDIMKKREGTFDNILKQIES